MKFRPKIFFLLLVFIFLCSGLALINLPQKAVFPYRVEQTTSGIMIQSAVQKTVPTEPIGKFIARLDDFPIQHPGQIETLIDHRAAGDQVQIAFTDGQSLFLTLPARFGSGFIMVSAVLSLAFLLIAWVVWRKATGMGEKYFAFSAVLMGYIIALARTGYVSLTPLSFSLNFLYYLCYPQAFFAFLIFCYTFPVQTVSEEKIRFIRPMPDGSGMELLKAFQTSAPQIPVLLLTAFGTIDKAVEAMKAGAENFLTKPVEPEHLLLTLQRLSEKIRLINQLQAQQLEVADRWKMVVGTSKAMHTVIRDATTAAQRDVTVLITGEFAGWYKYRSGASGAGQRLELHRDPSGVEYL